MIKAQSEGVAPEELIKRVAAEHVARLPGLPRSATTTSTRRIRPRTRRSPTISTGAQGHGHITTRSVRQAYDEQAGMFLPDRYVKGNCPVCDTADQYGDNCENCGATYAPNELINPVRRLAARRRYCASPSTTSSSSATSRTCCASGWRAAAPPARGARQARRVARRRACRTGTSRATRPTSASRSPARPASISTCGSTRPSATSAASRRCATSAG